jgi:hypothetical protein
MSSVKQRTILIYVLAGIFFLAIAVFVFVYLTSAKLTLLTNDASNTLYIHENSPNPRNIDVQQTGVKVFAQLEPGNYTVTSKNAFTSSMQVIDLKVGETRTISLNLETASGIIMEASAVTSFGASSFAAASDHLTFIDSNDDSAPLYTVDGQNVVHVIDNKHVYAGAKWADDTFGIGLVTTGATNFGLVKIDGATVSEIALPFTPQKWVDYAVAPNRTWYVGDGHKIYRANDDGTFTNVYNSNKFVSLASASNSAILMTEQDEKSAREGKLIVLHNDGKKYQIDGEQYESAWSPSGDKLVTSGDTSEIFDNKLHHTHHMPQGNFSSPVWLDDNTLLYTFGSKVWQYNVQTGRAIVIVSIDRAVGSLAMIRPDSSHDFLYTTLYHAKSSHPYTLSRVRLGDKPLPDSSQTAQHLTLVLPYTVAKSCSINFVNFTALTIPVKQLASGNDCVATAKSVFVYSKVVSSDEVSRLTYQQLP